jgi:hypothetical protein
VGPALVRNFSPLPVFGAEHRFYNGHQYNVLVTKCTFALIPGKPLKPLLDQPPIVMNDVNEGDADWATLRYPSDLIPFKSKVDVLVVGSAVPENGQAREVWLANIAIGDWQKTLKLCGPRDWVKSSLGGWTLDKPRATTGVPLLYELAYGGTVGAFHEPTNYYEWNPLGRGYIANDERLHSQIRLPAPQIEFLDSPVSSPNRETKVAGFAPVQDYFESRAILSGTWDKEWEQKVAPNIPHDMNLRFWNVAPEDQQLEKLNGDEVISLVGLLPEGKVEFALPAYRPRAILYDADENTDTRELVLDTVHIDLDSRRVTLRWSNLVDFDDGIVRAHMLTPEARIPVAA